MNRLWPLTSVLCLAGCSTQSDVKPRVAQVPPPRATPAVTATPAQAVQTSSPTLPLPTTVPKPVMDKRFEKEQQIVLRELQRLQNSTPEKDFETAWQNKDYKFVAVRTVATQVFGVPGDITNPLVGKYGWKAIEGTGDVRFSLEQEKLQKLATEYSLHYNRLLLKRLQGN
jgi:hypothetical protein